MDALGVVAEIVVLKVGIYTKLWNMKTRQGTENDILGFLNSLTTSILYSDKFLELALARSFCNLGILVQILLLIPFLLSMK